MEGRITNIQRFSVHDGPGIRTVVFLKGCSLRCRWCCNPEAMLPEPVLMFNPQLCIGCGECVRVCPNEASGTLGDITVDRSRCTGCGACAEVCYAEAKYLRDSRMSPEQLLEELKKDQSFYERTGGGVTFSGGEALLQAEFLEKILRLCKENRIGTAIETCGNVLNEYCRGWIYSFTTSSIQTVKSTCIIRVADVNGLWKTANGCVWQGKK